MKVLVISHNVFCQTTNMGKTLSAYFSGWNREDIAQMYVHSEVPSDDICANYYRITDKDAIKSIITRKSGTVFNGCTEQHKSNEAGDTRISRAMYKKGKSRTPFIYLVRNLWWRFGAWKTEKLLQWVDDFNPDIVFLASGDYAFIYRIALDLAKHRDIPLVVSCMDDYYFYNRNENRFLGKAVHRAFMKQVRKTMDYASCLFPICEKMSEDYGKLFGKPCYTLHTPASIFERLNFEKNDSISYIGNLGYKRSEQIVKLGKALKKIDGSGKPRYIDVYSMESNKNLLRDLTQENGIRFHGGISAERVLEVMGRSMAVIHTESFDEKTRKMVAYSVSTKIADSLASGTCILAYGPSEVASMDYLNRNKAAYCITDDRDLVHALSEFLANDALRDSIVENALCLARKNHEAEENCKMIAKRISALCLK